MKIEIHEPHTEREYNVTFDSHSSMAEARKRDEREETISVLRAKMEHLSLECQKLGKELQDERQKTRILSGVIIMQAIERQKLKGGHIYDSD